jgi:hypothetical protein
MVINKILLIFIASISIASCISLKHGKRVTTKDLSAKSFVVYESNEVELWFDKKEIFLSAKKHNIVDEKYYIDYAKKIDIESFANYQLPLFIVLETSPPIREIYFFLEEAKYELMKKGRVKIFNKKDKKFEKYFFYKRHRDKQNTTSDFFRLSNGIMFYSFLITFGE